MKRHLISYWHVLETFLRFEDKNKDKGISPNMLANFLEIYDVNAYTWISRLYSQGLLNKLNRNEKMGNNTKFILSGRAKGILDDYRIKTFLTAKNRLILNSMRRADKAKKLFRLWSQFQIEDKF